MNMPNKSILLNSLAESLSMVWKNKLLLALLLFLQTIFFIALFSMTLTYQTRILESAKAVSDYLSQQKLDEVSVASNMLEQKGILGDDPLSVSRNFDEIVRNFRMYLVYMFIFLVASMSINWALTIKLVYGKHPLPLAKIFLKILILSLLYLGLIFSFFFSLFNIPMAETANSFKLLEKYAPFSILSLMLAYFMFISISLLHRTGLKNIVQETLAIGIRKAHYVLSAYFINIFLFFISIFLLYYFIEKNLFVLLLSLALLIFSFVFGRIFLVKVAGKLEKSV